MKVLMNGALGKMGAQIWTLLESGKNGAEIACGVDINAGGSDSRIVKSLSDFDGKADVIIDFSHHACTAELMDYAVRTNTPCVVATTGHTVEELATIVCRSAAMLDIAIDESGAIEIAKH